MIYHTRFAVITGNSDQKREACDRIDIIRVCDDYGSQMTTLFSPDMWDEFFAENTKRFVDLAHKHNCYYMQHSCGAAPFTVIQLPLSGNFAMLAPKLARRTGFRHQPFCTADKAASAADAASGV